MQKSVQRIVDEIRFDKDLTPYFVDYIGENVKMNIARNLHLRGSGFVSKANSKLLVLLNQLEKKVPREHTDAVVGEVCRYYAAQIFLAKV